MKNKVREISNAILFSGLILLLIGAYYLIIKAGIPYQDPTVELQIKYAVNDGIGSVLSELGLIFILIGGSIRLIIWCICRKNRHGSPDR